MNILGSVMLIVAGILAAAAFIIARKPEAGKWINKIMPFNGWIGTLLFVWGAWYVVDVILHLGRYSEYMKLDPFWGFIRMLFIPATAVFLGFMLGFTLVAKWMPGQGRSEEKLLALQKKLIKITTPLGLLGILAGILHLFDLIFRDFS